VKNTKFFRKAKALNGSLHFFFTLTFSGFNTDFFIILLKGSKIFTSFGELTFLHTLSDVPMDEGSLGVHEIEFVINSGEDLSNGSGVRDHAACSHNLSKITTWYDSGWLIVNTALETSWAPVNELDGSLGLYGGDSGVDILGDDITSVHQAASHILSMSGIALGHHRSGLESWVGDLSYRELLVISFLSRNNWGIRRKHKMDTRIRYQVGLELSNIDVKGTVESEGSSERWDNLSNESVQVGVGGSLNIEVSSADIVDGFIIKHNSDISVLEEGVGSEDSVVRLNDSSRDLRRRIDGETELRLLTIVDWESFEKEGTKTWTSTTTDSVEDEETLETSTLIGKLSDSVKTEVDNFFTNGVVTTSKVVGGIFLTRDELFRMEELSVGTSTNFIDNSWF
jgi:hypothetical protein